MKKLIIIIVLLIIITILVFGVASRYSLKLGNLNIVLNKDKDILAEKIIDFLEDIEFKDFKKAATYHTPEDQKHVNIPKLIEEKFFVKPEFLDITKYEVKEIEIDRSGKRAKVKTRTIFKVLNTGKIKDLEIIFYFQKNDDGKWYMQLKSSL
ncbi:MAG TPA: hypothetical protein PL110_17565 [Candidatus Eremiobacteraeota bacterium]|mgnify:CR=1 FL=1|nr:MAG: hypothetical protein BWY64_03168 [bacterium ADurb.Bin363]HPZ09904.1 hypothetical protein [Candidatus Eremiobacteraeota bacterium]